MAKNLYSQFGVENPKDSSLKYYTKTRQKSSSPTVKVLGYTDDGFLIGQDIATKEEIRVRLATPKEYAFLYIHDKLMEVKEKLELAVQKIANRPSIRELCNPNNKNMYVPVGGVVRLNGVKKNGDVNVCQWIKGVSKAPEREVVIQGKIHLTRTVVDNPNAEYEVEKTRSFKINVLQDKLAKGLQLSADNVKESYKNNEESLNNMLTGHALDADGKPLLDEPAVTSSAMVSVELPTPDNPNGVIDCCTIYAPELIDENDPKKGRKNSSRGIAAIFDELVDKPLKTETTRDTTRSAVMCAIAVLTGREKQLQFQDEAAKNFASGFCDAVRNGKVRVTAVPQFSIMPSLSLKKKMTDVALSGRQAFGSLSKYCNEGYFDADICLRTGNFDAEGKLKKYKVFSANNVSPYKAVLEKDYKPLWVKPIMGQATDEVHPPREDIEERLAAEKYASMDSAEQEELMEEEPSYNSASPGM